MDDAACAVDSLDAAGRNIQREANLSTVPPICKSSAQREADQWRMATERDLGGSQSSGQWEMRTYVGPAMAIRRPYWRRRLQAP